MVLWEASDRICGKRLRPLIPTLVEAMERHGHLDLAEDVRSGLLSMSAATIDRALRGVREQAGGRRRKHPEFARALPQFVSELGRMFTPEEIDEHPARVKNERLQRAMEAMDVYDPELDDLAASDAEARRFEFVKELLTAPALGTSWNRALAGSRDRRTGRSWPGRSRESPSTIQTTASACSGPGRAAIASWCLAARLGSFRADVRLPV